MFRSFFLKICSKSLFIHKIKVRQKKIEKLLNSYFFENLMKIEILKEKEGTCKSYSKACTLGFQRPFFSQILESPHQLEVVLSKMKHFTSNVIQSRRETIKWLFFQLVFWQVQSHHGQQFLGYKVFLVFTTSKHISSE